MGLFDRELVADEQGLVLIVVGLDQLPGRAVAVGAMKADLLADLADQLVGDLGFAPISVNSAGTSRLEMSADGLSMHRGHSLDRAQALTAQPQPQELTDLETREPPGMTSPPSWAAWVWRRVQPQRRRRWWMLRGGPITGERVVPCCWRNSSWSHATGGRQEAGRLGEQFAPEPAVVGISKERKRGLAAASPSSLIA